MITSLLIFLGLLLLGMPVVFAIGIAGFVFFLLTPGLQPVMPVQLALSETQNFALLAIPTFILAGNLMNEAGVTRRLVQFATLLTGHLAGGLGQVSVLASTLMGGVSGSAIADASMQARVLGPEMQKRGYTPGFIAALQGFTGLLAVMIPPSIALILYGSIGQVSIGRLFAGGIGVGLLLALIFMLVVAFLAKKRQYPRERASRAPTREITSAFLASFWALVFPLILLITLRGGVFVPSEVGAAACVYALLLGSIIYRELGKAGLVRALKQSVADIGMISFLIACSALIGYAMKWEMWPQKLGQFLVGLQLDTTLVVLVILLALLVMGAVLDSTVMIILLTPILVPAMKALGVDLVHFGVLMALTCAVGLLTPPVGLSMYAVCSIMRCSVAEYLREGWPLLLAVLATILAALFFSPLVTTLPNLLFNR